MNRLPLLTKVVCLALACTLVFVSFALCAEKMPASKAGTIGAPEGQIAFLREKNVWTMEATGAKQTKVCEVGNAEGRLSWAPDGQRIAFTRSGKATLSAPDNMGGMHKVYDIFVAYVDSGKTGNTFFWRRLTNNLGSRDPEWSVDGKSIVYYRDMNANLCDPEMPNYQVCTMDSAGAHVSVLRKDWQNMPEYFKNPTMNANGEIVFVHFITVKQAGMQGSGFKSRGLARANKSAFQIPLDSVRAMSGRKPDMVGPAWSPDGKWIAYVGNSMSNQGLFIAPADFSEEYLVFAPPPGASIYSTAPSFSPDSKWLTFGTTDGSVWICDITGNGAVRLTGPGLDGSPAWSKAAVK